MTKEKMFLTKIFDFGCGRLRFVLVGVQFWDCVQKLAKKFHELCVSNREKQYYFIFKTCFTNAINCIIIKSESSTCRNMLKKIKYILGNYIIKNYFCWPLWLCVRTQTASSVGPYPAHIWPAWISHGPDLGQHYVAVWEVSYWNIRSFNYLDNLFMIHDALKNIEIHI